MSNLPKRHPKRKQPHVWSFDSRVPSTSAPSLTPHTNTCTSNSPPEVWQGFEKVRRPPFRKA
eukprot:312927-Prymnesium_polylepis.1